MKYVSYTINNLTMNTEHPMEDRLWDYIDGLSSPAERSLIEALIAENREWQGKHRLVLNNHQLSAGSELEATPVRSTKNALVPINPYPGPPPTQNYMYKNIIRVRHA